MTTHRYLVFAGECYYSAGGAANLIGYASSEADAWRMVDARVSSDDYSYDWCHALDTHTNTVITRPGWDRTGYGMVSNETMLWNPPCPNI